MLFFSGLLNGGGPVKKIVLLVLLLSALFPAVLSGCSKLDIDYVINENGTVDISYIMAVSSPEQDMVQVDGLLDAAREQAANNGFTLSSYSKDGYKGFKAAKTVKNSGLKDADPSMIGFEVLPSIFKDFTWSHQPGLFENQYRLGLDVDLSGIIDISSLDSLPPDLKEQALEAIKASEVTISFTLPGKVQNQLTGKTQGLPGRQSTRVEWVLKPGDKERLEIHTILNKQRNRDMAVLLSAAALGLCCLILIIPICRKRRRRTYISH